MKLYTTLKITIILILLLLIPLSVHGITPVEKYTGEPCFVPRWFFDVLDSDCDAVADNFVNLEIDNCRLHQNGPNQPPPYGNQVDTNGNGIGDACSNIINTAPIADFIFSPRRQGVFETITFTSTATDAENNIELYEWDFNDDGVVDLRGSDKKEVFGHYIEPGT